jgi:hypothetical protein
MPSKKKTSGWSKKGRKAANMVEEQQETPDAQMERLKIDEDTEADEDALLEEAIKLAAAEKEALDAEAANRCGHGYVRTEDYLIIEDFANTFLSGHDSIRLHKMTLLSVAKRFTAASKASTQKYPKVWNDSSKLKQVISSFIAIGTQNVLEGDINGARSYASLARYFEEYIALYLHKTKAAFDVTKVIELSSADEHTLVKYLKKRIPCSCLDEKYKEVKAITKMGVCCNPQCHVPDRMVERSKMLYCTRCRNANYCSRECQEAAWPIHKELCDKYIRARAELDSRK